MAHTPSPFAVAFPPMPEVPGVRLATGHTGMRYRDRDDLLLVELAEGTVAACMLTTNSLPGEPVKWCRRQLSHGQARGLVVNAGYSNVFTGEQGYRLVEKTAAAAAELLQSRPEEIFIASTGIIGQQVPEKPLLATLPKLFPQLSPHHWEAAGKAIITTDTFTKGASCTATIGSERVVLNGFAKGSGMIEPNMATMLSFFFTNARIPLSILQLWLAEATDHSYHSITVDSDSSTSDTVLCFATGKSDHWTIKSPYDPAWQDFREKFLWLHQSLARQVVLDGEGISKAITIEVRGAKDNFSARRIGKAIANSPLVKTAIAGEDANWGRVVMAIGKSGEPCNPDKTCIWFGQYLMALNGQLYPAMEVEEVDNYLKNKEILIAIDVGVGEGEATIWTMDLTHQYIAINADYRS